MSLAFANAIVTGAGVYLSVGFCFAALFVALGAPRIDPGAKGMPVRARLLVLPGAALLWPLMLVKWLSQTEPPVS